MSDSSSIPQASASIIPADESSTTSSSTATTKRGDKSEPGVKHLVAGSLAGMASKTLLQPLDLIKVRLQLQTGSLKHSKQHIASNSFQLNPVTSAMSSTISSNASLGLNSASGPPAHEYRGVLDALQRVLKSEGFSGLYRGLTPNLMAAGISWGVYFFSYNHFKSLAKNFINRPSLQTTSPQSPTKHQLGPVAHLSCAALSGCIATTLTNPIVMVKTRLQLQRKDLPVELRTQHPYNGMYDCFNRIVREEGFSALYRGLGPSLALVSNGALQFMCYEELKKLMITYVVHSDDNLQSIHYFTMGGLAKIFSASVTYPLALTRSRLFAGKSTTRTYNTIGDVITSTWKYEGWRGFYRGLTPQLMKTAPSSALTFLFYETVVGAWTKMQQVS